MKFTFEQIQQAFINEDITLEQFIQVLIENFGQKKTRKILKKNLALALEKEAISEAQKLVPSPKTHPQPRH